MAENDKGAWWGTFPGVLTAVAAVITAATALITTGYSVGWFRRPDPIIPVVEVPKSQVPSPAPATLIDHPAAAPLGKVARPTRPHQELEYVRYLVESALGEYSVLYPKNLLVPGEKTARALRFDAVNGTALMLVRAVGSGGDSVTDLRERLVTQKGIAPWKLLAETHDLNTLELSLKNGPRLQHRKFLFIDQFSRSIILEYDESERAIFDDVWTRVSDYYPR